jgi:hypothetical protein
MSPDPRYDVDDVPHTESPFWPPRTDQRPINIAAAERGGVLVLRVIAYVLTSVTCVAVLYALVELYLFAGRLQAALQNFSDGLNGLGL